MEYEITPGPGYLRAKLYGRETIEETRVFIRSIVRESQEHHPGAILIEVHQSRVIFHSEPNGLLDYFKRLGRGSACRIALLGDTAELRLSHEYLALLARQQGLNVRSFEIELAALHWLSNRRHAEDRRYRMERRNQAAPRDIAAQRRRRHRRFGPQEGSGDQLQAG
jgi:hypothetical protein